MVRAAGFQSIVNQLEKDNAEWEKKYKLLQEDREALGKSYQATYAAVDR